jgi:hypothetical protein
VYQGQEKTQKLQLSKVKNNSPEVRELLLTEPTPVLKIENHLLRQQLRNR